MIEVLIVEDEADILDILTFNLENAGYKVLAASSAEDGIRMLGPDTSSARRTATISPSSS